MKTSDEQLRNALSLTRLGDRLSLRSFCENHCNKTSECSNTHSDIRKKRLIEELAKKRIKKQHNVQSGQKGLSVSAKSTRRVELAWLNNYNGG